MDITKLVELQKEFGKGMEKFEKASNNDKVGIIEALKLSNEVIQPLLSLELVIQLSQLNIHLGNQNIILDKVNKNLEKHNESMDSIVSILRDIEFNQGDEI